MKTDWLLSLFGTLLIGSITAYLAKGRGRNPTIWFFIGMGLGIFGLAALLLLPPITEANAVSKQQEPQIQSEPDEVIVHPISPEVDVWFFLDESRNQHGPLSFDDFKKQWEEKLFFPSSYVWCQGMSDWKKVMTIEGLENRLNS